MTTTPALKHGVILSGGGANGAYEVGVLKALCAGKSPATQYQPLDPDIFAGTSVGSYNAAFLVARWGTYGSAAVASLEHTWLESISSNHQRLQNGVFRIRDSPLGFLNPMNFLLNPLQPFEDLLRDSATLAWDGLQRTVNSMTAREMSLLERVTQLFDFTSFVSLEPFQQTLQETLWFSEIRRSQKSLLIVTTNWEMGTVKIYTNHDMTDQFGPLIILGSSAIPGIFPPTAIGSQLFVDGGVLLNTPLNPLIDEGATVLHVISLFPHVEQVPLGDITYTLGTMYRQQLISWAHTLASSIKRVRDINRMLTLVALISETLQPLRERQPGGALSTHTSMREIEQFLDQYRRYTPVTVHSYYPGDDIGGPLGLLDFNYQRVKMLIERGFEDTVDHDCAVNHCVIVPEHMLSQQERRERSS